MIGLAWHPRSGHIWFTAQSVDHPGGLMLYDAALDGRVRLVLTVPGLVRVEDIDATGNVLLRHSLWPNTLVCRPRGSARESDLSWLDFSVLIDLSPDGKTVLLVEDGIAGGGAGAIYLRPVDGGDAGRLGDGEPLALSPDGKWVLAHPAHAATAFEL